MPEVVDNAGTPHDIASTGASKKIKLSPASHPGPPTPSVEITAATPPPVASTWCTPEGLTGYQYVKRRVIWFLGVVVLHGRSLACAV